MKSVTYHASRRTLRYTACIATYWPWKGHGALGRGHSRHQGKLANFELCPKRNSDWHNFPLSTPEPTARNMLIAQD